MQSVWHHDQDRFSVVQSTQADYYSFSDETATQGYAVPGLPFDFVSAQWPLYCTYAEPEYHHCAAPGPGPDVQYPSSDAEIPLYAPIPVSSYAMPLADTDDEVADNSGTSASLYSMLDSDFTPELKPLAAEEKNPLDVFLDAPQVLFPTPSELLTDLNTRESVSRPEPMAVDEKSSSRSSLRPSLGKRKREAREKPENLNQRKAYFRSVSGNVGFMITDPDSITSHDKKRSYLECLEEYVQWLHERMQLVGLEASPLERISSYRGLKNSSLRTILVHMQDRIKSRNLQKLEAENRFMELQNAILMRQAAEESLQFRRHSIAMGAVPHGIIQNFAA